LTLRPLGLLPVSGHHTPKSEPDSEGSLGTLWMLNFQYSLIVPISNRPTPWGQVRTDPSRIDSAQAARLHSRFMMQGLIKVRLFYGRGASSSMSVYDRR